MDGDTIFEGGQVTGGGNYAPASNNTVNVDTTIDVSQFNFDRGSWTINPDATPDGASGRLRLGLRDEQL